MATRNSGRNEDRSTARSASGNTRAPDASSTRSATGGTQPSGASQQSSATRQSSAAQQNSTARPSGRAANDTSTSQPDRQRELNTSREQGTARSGTSTNRNDVGSQDADYSSAVQTTGSGSPFAMMRQMMDDMDRLFSEFGFMHPGQIASSLFGPDWISSGSPRALGTASSSAGARSLPSQNRGQQGLQRSGQRGLQSSSLQSFWAPLVEVFERGNNLVVRADLPGLNRDDVDVEVDNDALIIRGERHNDFEDEQEGYYRSERSYGSFYRAIPLPEGVDPNACNATFRDGVLEVTLPKPPQQVSRARKINVK
jgi:HSP20 family protein